jgi:ABC-type branched-subunit amino acid transport system ATPase component
MSAVLLEVEDLYAGYISGVNILQGLSLAVEHGSLTLVIGPNGAGKSTLLRAIFGLINPQRGHIRFAGQAIAGREPVAIKTLGIGYVPQEINVFPLLTVEENLRMGGWIFRRDRRGWQARSIACLRSFRRSPNGAVRLPARSAAVRGACFRSRAR